MFCLYYSRFAFLNLHFLNNGFLSVFIITFAYLCFMKPIKVLYSCCKQIMFGNWTLYRIAFLYLCSLPTTATQTMDPTLGVQKSKFIFIYKKAYQCLASGFILLYSKNDLPETLFWPVMALFLMDIPTKVMLVLVGVKEKSPHIIVIK